MLSRYKDVKWLMDHWKNLKKNIDWLKRSVDRLKRDAQDAERRQQEAVDRKKNEMSEAEVKVALAKQARLLMVDTRKNTGKKVIMKMEAIQLLGKLNIAE